MRSDRDRDDMHAVTAPFRGCKDPDRINNRDDGRGVYFDDPNGHRLETITRPYGSGGTEARHPHPLIAPPIKGSYGRTDIH